MTAQEAVAYIVEEKFRVLDNPFLTFNEFLDPKGDIEEFDDYNDEDIDIGYCQGCGRYGYAGKTCIRKIDGQMEECGEFL
jgi:hypothetical protein